MESLTASKRRIRHIYHHDGAEPGWDKYPRGWITPEGRFLKTKEHWKSITCQFRRTDVNSAGPVSSDEDIEDGERISQLAYSLGWVSLGHAGKLNAIGHDRILRSFQNPAKMTLQQLLSDTAELAIHVELQIGRFDPSLGVHEDFVVKEFDLDRFIKRGRLIECR
jgi:hypothetical protein